MSANVVRAGLLTTIQDAGRFGYRQAGVIVSGPLDAPAMRLANLLVGNPAGAAALEITLLGPTLRFEADHLICLTGADLSATLDGQALPRNRAVALRRGAELSFGAARAGCRAYLAFSGGLGVPAVLGSQATYLRAGLGGLHGRALRAGDELPAPGPTPAGRRLHRHLLGGLPAPAWRAAPWFPHPQLTPAPVPVPVVRALPGPEYDWFTPESRQALWEAEFTVTAQSDRMGYRLAGPALHPVAARELLSAAVTFGTVQVPAGGPPLVLLADHPTTGGYPRMAQVISADFRHLAQLPPGGRLRFQPVGFAEAQDLCLHQERLFQQLHRGLTLLHYP